MGKPCGRHLFCLRVVIYEMTEYNSKKREARYGFVFQVLNRARL
jgi:hypothetical protein